MVRQGILKINITLTRDMYIYCTNENSLDHKKMPTQIQINLTKPTFRDLKWLQQKEQEVTIGLWNETTKIPAVIKGKIVTATSENNRMVIYLVDAQHAVWQKCYFSEIICWSAEVDFKTDLVLFISNLPNCNNKHVDCFFQLKLKFEKVNLYAQKHFGESETINTENFFLKYAKKISLLVQIMDEFGFKWMSDHLVQTVFGLEEFFDHLPSGFSEESIQFLKNLANHNEINQFSNEKLACYKNILIGFSLIEKNGYIESFLKRGNSSTVEALSISVNHQLLDIIYDKLHFSLELRENAKAKLSELISSSEFAAFIKEREKISELMPSELELIDSYLTGKSIDYFLHDVDQLSGFGKKVAIHNSRIQFLLSQKGIHPEIALRYSKTHEFSYEPSGFKEAVILIDFLKKWVVIFEDLKNKITDQKSQSQLNAILQNAKQIIAFKDSPLKIYEQHNDGKLQLIQKNIDALKNKYSKTEQAADFFKFGFDYEQRYKKVKSIDVSVGALKKPMQFRVEQWDKGKANSLFLGNEVDCCLATDGFYFTALFYRILDDAVLFHVFIDEKTQKPIALTWLYFATTTSDEIVLVANFVEIKARYGKDESLRKTIIDSLLFYTGDMYCKDNPGIKCFVINELDYGYNAEKIPFPKEKISLFDKVGGAAFVPICFDGMQRQKVTIDHYHFHSLERAIENPDGANFHVYGKCLPQCSSRFFKVGTTTQDVVPERSITSLSTSRPAHTAA